MSENNVNNNEQNTETNFQIQRVFLKDVSFEAPKATEMFQKNWEPEVKLDLDTEVSMQKFG